MEAMERNLALYNAPIEQLIRPDSTMQEKIIVQNYWIVPFLVRQGERIELVN